MKTGILNVNLWHLNLLIPLVDDPIRSVTSYVCKYGKHLLNQEFSRCSNRADIFSEFLVQMVCRPIFYYTIRGVVGECSMIYQSVGRQIIPPPPHAGSVAELNTAKCGIFFLLIIRKLISFNSAENSCGIHRMTYLLGRAG